MSTSYIPRALRLAIFDRDESQCVYCLSDEELTIDHVVAEKWGGLTAAGNLVTCCAECNENKGVIHADLFAIFLERQGKGKAKDIMARLERHLAIRLP